METLIRDSGIAYTPEDLTAMQAAFDRACGEADLSEEDRRVVALSIFEAYRHGCRDSDVLAGVGRSAIIGAAT